MSEGEKQLKHFCDEFSPSPCPPPPLFPALLHGFWEHPDAQESVSGKEG